MTLLYATPQEEKHQILVLLQRHTNDVILIAQTEGEIIVLARKHRPQKIFMFMPGEAGSAIEIQDYIRQFLPHCRIRILPSQRPTTKLLAGWEKVVTKAFRNRSKPRQKAVRS
jgi:hypothetical protein